MPQHVIYLSAVIIAVGAAPLPYGYYTLLRIVACCIFAWAAYVAYERHKKVLPWLYVALVILFNPVIKVHLSKDLWALVDIAAAVFLVASSKAITDARG